MKAFDPDNIEKITIRNIKRFKKAGVKISVLTAYDYPTAVILDKTGIEIVLVGDTLNTVFCGEKNNISATMDQMIYHTSIVSKGLKRALLVGDMPFMSFQADSTVAVKNAGRFLKEGKAECVKIEGGQEVIPTIKRILDAGIPVMGHIGLTPQSVHKFGGYIVRGRRPEVRQYLIDSAKALEDTGVFSMVLESIPSDLGKTISESVCIPTIGIGAGPFCDGQVLVIYDMLGFFHEIEPKYVRRYDDFTKRMEDAVKGYMNDVRSNNFPTEDESYS
ncbi:MAG: 3-methyl-2-oxobutanoate hydroxymethyltransferase [candidate division Zixibacteria bacterium]|nr:3-methyl-2-oxobutanoate hydroxymethyltransferase [candidate division Zixibacteria bacterium]